MPIKIIELQRRFAEQGRIRLGHQVSTENGTRPAKLDKFRFTSPNERHINDLAALYGGTPRKWDNNGKPEFEVYSETQSIPVFVVKGGLSQWLEFWSGGGCIHRCDGETNQLTGLPCDLEEKVTMTVRGRKVQVNPHNEAKPTTRLSMMLPELESIGVWRLESHGWNAAVEIPAVAELAQFVGDLVPAALELQERRAIKDGKTSRFVVPVLDLKIATHRLREIVEAKVNGGVLESSAQGGRRELEAGGGASSVGAGAPAEGAAGDSGGDPYTPFFERLAACTTVPEAQDLWHEMVGLKLVGTEAAPSPRASEFFEAFKAAGQRLPKGEPGQPVPDADGVVDAEIVEDADGIWERIVRAGGDRGMSLPDIEQDFSIRSGGIESLQASAAELQAYLNHLEAVPAA